MSDFGTMALVSRADNGDMGQSDEAVLKAAIAQLRTVERDRISDYEEFSFQLGKSYGQAGGVGFCVEFSAYWLGDEEGNEGLDSETILERDEPLARQCCGELAEILGEPYFVELVCDHW